MKWLSIWILLSMLAASAWVNLKQQERLLEYQEAFTEIMEVIALVAKKED